MMSHLQSRSEPNGDSMVGSEARMTPMVHRLQEKVEKPMVMQDRLAAKILGRLTPPQYEGWRTEVAGLAEKRKKVSKG